MELLAVLSPAGVRRSMLHAAGEHGLLGQEEQVPEVVDRALARLVGASLLTFSVDGSAVIAHRLVMRVIREQAAARNALAAICVSAAQLLGQLPEPLCETWHEDRDAARDLVEQIVALYRASAACPDDGDLTRLLLRLRWWAVAFLTYLGDSSAQSIAIAEPLLADQERMLGTDHHDTLATRNHLANGYYTAGRAAEAITLHEQNLAIQEQAVGNDHPDTLAMRSNLGLAYKAAGRTSEAVALCERTLAESERVLGSEYSDTVIARCYLGRVYQAAGRTTEAIALHEKNVLDCERVLGSGHPCTLQERGYLAVAYQDAGRTAEAITMLIQILADCERVLGVDHPDTLKVRNNLASAYRAGGQTE
jgi:tetratricopeptide (TPR) repeat protein